uniref:Integrase catalytic domain-containing protein n=1 Tax=Rhizophora mucronata TaxID=61149 RepID=A0A2P2JVQ0_RHIMU
MKVRATFLSFKALVKNQFGCKLKTLRSDNGAEFTLEAFKQHCAATEILQHFTTSYTT